MAHLTSDPETHLADNLFVTREYDRDPDGTVYTSFNFRLKLFRDVKFTLDGDEALFHKHAADFLAGKRDDLEFSYNCGFIGRNKNTHDYHVYFHGREGGSITLPLTEREAFAVVREVLTAKKTAAHL